VTRRERRLRAQWRYEVASDFLAFGSIGLFLGTMAIWIWIALPLIHW